jgi:hypothetical protein
MMLLLYVSASKTIISEAVYKVIQIYHMHAHTERNLVYPYSLDTTSLMTAL